MGVRFEIEGDVQVERKLLRFAEAADDMTPAWKRIDEQIRGFERSQFGTQGASGSGGWAPLKPRTVAFKARNNLDPRILHATGRLRKSFTNKTDPDHVLRFGKDWFFSGSKTPYAGVHQNPKPSNPLPQRRPVELTETQRKAIVRTVQAHLVKAGKHLPAGGVTT